MQAVPRVNVSMQMMMDCRLDMQNVTLIKGKHESNLVFVWVMTILIMRLDSPRLKLLS